MHRIPPAAAGNWVDTGEPVHDREDFQGGQQGSNSSLSRGSRELYRPGRHRLATSSSHEPGDDDEVGDVNDLGAALEQSDNAIPEGAGSGHHSDTSSANSSATAFPEAPSGAYVAEESLVTLSWPIAWPARGRVPSQKDTLAAEPSPT